MLHPLVRIFFAWNIHFLLISRGISFKGEILVKFFDPLFVCTTGISSSVQLRTVPTISRLLPTLSLDQVFSRIHFVVNLFGYPDFMKPMRICNRPGALLTLSPQQLLVLVNYIHMCPYFPQLYQVHCVVVLSLPQTSYAFFCPCCVELTHDIP